MVWVLSILLILLLGLTGWVLVALMGVQRCLRVQAEGATAAALTAAEARLREGQEALRQAAGQADALQRQELGATLARHAEQTERQLGGVRTLVAETLPGQVERSVEARFRADFAQVALVLREVRERLVQLEGLNGGVGALQEGVKRFSQMLGNVKARGTWGEWQLGNILTDMMAPGQFATNVHPNPRAPKRVVEFAIALPGDDERRQVWLLIDSKCPQEDYERLLRAAQQGDREAEAEAEKALVARIRGFARDVREAYIMPPHTTDFAILFLPTEGLYLEMLRHADAVSEIQQKQKVLLAGPTTLAALINALQMGFQTLAVQRNTVKVLDALKCVRDRLETFEEKNGKLVKALQSASAAAEADARQIHQLQSALKKVSFGEDHDEQTDEAERDDA